MFDQFGESEYFNSDQGAQFTSQKFQELFAGHSMKISMDGKRRWVDNIFIERFWRTLKWEETYLKLYSTIGEMVAGLESYIKFYNEGRTYSSLSYKKPAEVYWGEVGEIPKVFGNKTRR
jgi:putative transposase